MRSFQAQIVLNTSVFHASHVLIYSATLFDIFTNKMKFEVSYCRQLSSRIRKNLFLTNSIIDTPSMFVLPLEAVFSVTATLRM